MRNSCLEGGIGITHPPVGASFNLVGITMPEGKCGSLSFHCIPSPCKVIFRLDGSKNFILTNDDRETAYSQCEASTIATIYPKTETLTGSLSQSEETIVHQVITPDVEIEEIEQSGDFTFSNVTINQTQSDEELFSSSEIAAATVVVASVGASVTVLAIIAYARSVRLKKARTYFLEH